MLCLPPYSLWFVTLALKRELAMLKFSREILCFAGGAVQHRHWRGCGHSVNEQTSCSERPQPQYDPAAHTGVKGQLVYCLPGCETSAH